MGIMTRDQFVSEVASVMGRNDLTTYLQSMADRVLLELNTYFRFPEALKKATLTLVSGNNTVATPSDLQKPIRLEYNDGCTIRIVTFKDLIFVRNQFSVNVSGLPDFVARFGSTYYFDRTADQNYAFDFFYRYRVAVFSGASAVSPFSNEWDEAIIIGMLSKGYRKINQFETAKSLAQDFYAYIKSRLPDLELEEESFNEPFPGDIDGDAVTGW